MVMQEVRGEKDAIEQRIDDLAQDAAGVSHLLLVKQQVIDSICVV